MENMEKYLLINAGSSSLKFKLYEMPERKEIVNGVFERIGDVKSNYTLKFGGKKINKNELINNHTDAANIMVKELLDNHFIDDVSEIAAVGHRVLLGGGKYKESIMIDEEALEFIESLCPLVPLHHPGQLAGIRAMQNVLPETPMIAVFDNAFHQTMPDKNSHYAIDERWYRKHGICKYGFHGISYQYITEYMQKALGKRNVNLIVCHIGSGASVCCVKNGKSYDTTMGLTPLDGLVMGTRCGNVDASVFYYMFVKTMLEKRSNGEEPNAEDVVQEIYRKLNLESGLKGLSGVNDFRDIERLAKIGDYEAIRARDMLKDSIIKYISYYNAELRGNVDAIVFTAGIGENAPKLREDIMNELSYTMPIKLNKEENSEIAGFKDKKSGIISTDDSKFPVMVVPTDEEYIILRDTYEIYQNLKQEKESSFQKKIGSR